MFFENLVHNRWKNKDFQYLLKIQSHRVTASLKAGDLKFLTYVTERYFCANKFFFFVTTYGSAPERLFVTTYGTSVQRKRVKSKIR